MKELWVPGYEGRYTVSDQGTVTSHVRGAPRALTAHVNTRSKYLFVRLSSGAVPKDTRNLYVHRLVLKAFVGPCPAGREGRHLNGDKYDLRVENLEWGTPSENIADTVRHGTHANAAKETCPQAHPYDEANTYRLGGRRYCRACKRERAA